MSLLLDALKKAAEQRKKQTGAAEPDTGFAAGDTTVSNETKTEPIDDSEYRDTHVIPVEDSEYILTDIIEPHDSDDTQIVTAGAHTEQTLPTEESEPVDAILNELEGRFDEETSDNTVIPDFDEEDTMSSLTSDDVSDFLVGTEIQIDSAVDDPTVDEDKDIVEEEEEDLSLHLAVQKQADDTTTPAVNTQEARVEMYAGRVADAEGFEYAEHPQQEPEQTSTVPAEPVAPEGVAGIELESLKHESTIMRKDATATHTYAPDNYDRTLIQPGAEQAGRVFSGVKAEDSLLMTPDYAKRLFLSKSSASRSQLYKLYTAIVLFIVLGIGMYTAIELEDEVEQIDSTLAQLKRDPMPGLIKNRDAETDTGLFEDSAGAEVDNKTLKLIESALQEEVTAGNDTEADPLHDTNNVFELEPGSEVVTEKQDTVTVIVTESTTVTQEDNQVTEIVQPAKQGKRKSSGQPSAGSLQIITNSKPEEKTQWLAEAYRAYQSGDDEIALQKYNKVLAIEPTNRNALLARAAISIQNSDIKSAIDDYRTLLLANPKDSSAMSSLISIGNISPQQSETQLKLMIREEPESPHLYFVLANIYGSQKRWQEAQSHYFKALEITPDNPNYAYNLAISLEHIAKPNIAIAYYKKALINFENGLATFNKDVVDRRIEMLRRL